MLILKVFHTLFQKIIQQNNYWLFQKVTNDTASRYFHIWKNIGINQVHRKVYF